MKCFGKVVKDVFPSNDQGDWWRLHEVVKYMIVFLEQPVYYEGLVYFTFIFHFWYFMYLHFPFLWKYFISFTIKTSNCNELEIHKIDMNELWKKWMIHTK